MSQTNSTQPTQFAGKSPVALFDAAHGQANWSMTGFPSREMHTNFAGLAEILCRRGFECRPTNHRFQIDPLVESRLLILPPPTGKYDERYERWQPDALSFLNGEEISVILDFLRAGGSLLVFGYRFGDYFTQTNLGDLFGPLGCLLNDDAVIDVSSVRQIHPLEFQFTVPADSLVPEWSRNQVAVTHWRSTATFTILPGTNIFPIALSPGGTCLSFNRTQRRICFYPQPLAVAGQFGRGRFALFGGPHLFESSSLGLLNQGDNKQFLHNVLDWLLTKTSTEVDPVNRESVNTAAIAWSSKQFIDSAGPGAYAISAMERVLRKSGVLRALSRARWIP